MAGTLAVLLFPGSGPGPRIPMESLQVAGGVRHFRLHRPARPARPQPLVVMLHGRGGSALEIETTTRWKDVADREGFTVAYPQGVGDPRTFDSGWGEERDNPDVRFLRALVRELPHRWPIDRARIYVCGHSSGGMMAARMAAAIPEELAAVGLVAGTVGIRRDGGVATVPRPAHPVPVVVLHGMLDDTVPYGGGGWRDFLSVEDTLTFFRDANSARRGPSITRDGLVTRESWRGESPRSEVLLVRVEGLSHFWPEGPPNAAISASEELWRFFRRYPAEGS